MTAQVSTTLNRTQNSAQILDMQNGLTDRLGKSDQFSAYFLEAGSGWYRSIDYRLSRFLIKLFSDEIVANILTLLMNKPMTIPQILQICESPQTSTYRKFNLLANYGIVKERDYLLRGTTRVYSYYSILEGIKIEFNGKATLHVKMDLREIEYMWERLQVRKECTI